MFTNLTSVRTQIVSSTRVHLKSIQSSFKSDLHKKLAGIQYPASKPTSLCYIKKSHLYNNHH